MNTGGKEEGKELCEVQENIGVRTDEPGLAMNKFSLEGFAAVIGI